MAIATPPILLLAFRRPIETELVFASIRNVKPKLLFIAIDGPRLTHPEDKERIAHVKQIVSRVDWDCQVFRLYQKRNLGLEQSVSQALTWFFSQVEAGIILEDDCVADPSFYPFAASMLSKYRNDERVMAINASNFLHPKIHDPKMYYFSKYPHFWGWASWRRAWAKYDGQMTNWPKIKLENRFANRYHNFWHRKYFETIFDATYEGKTNSWGYRWFYSVWQNEGICVTPGVNLVTNIGFNHDATHPVLRKFELPVHAIDPNPKIAMNKIHTRYDKMTADRYYAITPFMFIAQRVFYLLKIIYGKIIQS